MNPERSPSLRAAFVYTLVRNPGLFCFMFLAALAMVLFTLRDVALHRAEPTPKQTASTDMVTAAGPEAGPAILPEVGRATPTIPSRHRDVFALTTQSAGDPAAVRLAGDPFAAPQDPGTPKTTTSEIEISSRMTPPKLPKPTPPVVATMTPGRGAVALPSQTNARPAADPPRETPPSTDLQPSSSRAEDLLPSGASRSTTSDAPIIYTPDSRTQARRARESLNAEGERPRSEDNNTPGRYRVHE